MTKSGRRLVGISIAVAALAVLAGLGYPWLKDRITRHWFKTEYRSGLCVDRTMELLAKAGKKGLVHYVGSAPGDAATDETRLDFNLFIGNPPPNPPLGESAFYTDSAVCTFDRKGIISIVFHSGPVGANGKAW